MKISHITWNICGLSFPLIIAATTIPNLITRLGHERFGLLTLAWGLIGYAGALDLGIGRATTQRIASLRNQGQKAKENIATTLKTAIRITSFISIFVAGIISTATQFEITHYIKIQQVSNFELKLSIILLAFCIPLQATSATYKGTNEAYLNFKGISIIRIILGAANFGVPYLITLSKIETYYLILGLFISRLLAFFAYRQLTINNLKKDKIQIKNGEFNKHEAKELIKFGGWFTLSGLLNPIVSNSDRFIISSIISATAVSWYVVPYEFVIQSLILIGALTTVTFPYFSQIQEKSKEALKKIYYKIILSSSLFMLVITIIYEIFSKTILTMWLNQDLAEKYFPVVKILALGLVPYTIGTICISILHAQKNTAKTAILNIIEFPIFIIITYFMIEKFGIEGAAWAWIIKTGTDAILLLTTTIISNEK